MKSVNHTVRNKRSEIRKLETRADLLLQSKYTRENPECLVCGQSTSEMHHYIPKSQSNTLRYSPNNLVPLCRGCHFRHHNTGDPRIMATILRKKGLEWDEQLNIERRKITKNTKDYLEGIIESLSTKTPF